MATLFLIRHAEPTVKGVFLGRMDPPLSARGQRQAAEALAGLQVRCVFSSPLRRAWDTAQYIACERIEMLADLREVDMGKWTGKTWAEVEAEAGEKAADWLGVPAPGGEAWSDVVLRAESALAKIRVAPEPVAVVAHQGINAALAQIAAGFDPLKFHQEYAQICRIEI